MEQKTIDLAVIAGQNLKRLIKESQFKTQARFAEAMFVDTKTVSRWCNQGIGQLSLLSDLANILEVDVFSLLSL